MTPEGRVKAAIDKVLKAAPYCYYHKPVQNGMGAPTLDYVGCSRGRYFTIEAKAPGKEPTARQKATLEQVQYAGGTTFVIDGPGEAMDFLTEWLA